MKKIIAILLTLCLLFVCTASALADSSEVYDLCANAYAAHLTSSHYSGVRLDKVVTVNPVTHKTSTLIKYTTITADAGFVSGVLKNAGMLDGKKTRAELKSLTTVSPVVDGAVLFKYSRTGAVSMVGIYAGGYQFYISGGCVVMEAYTPSCWKRVGVLP